MAKLVNAVDLESTGLAPWGFESPSLHVEKYVSDGCSTSRICKYNTEMALSEFSTFLTDFAIQVHTLLVLSFSLTQDIWPLIFILNANGTGAKWRRIKAK
jgi:hypothetical protein